VNRARSRSIVRVAVVALGIVAATMGATSCSTFADYRLDTPLLPLPDFQPTWESRFVGVDFAVATQTDPPLVAYCVRVALDAPGVECLVSPPDGDVYRLRRPTTVARAERYQIAVNATPFSPVTLAEGALATLSGLSISGGRAVSPPSGRYAAILFFGDGHAAILTAAELAPLAARWPDLGAAGLAAVPMSGAGGFALILRAGQVRHDQFDGMYRENRAPRSAIGVSADGRTLYLLVIDGKNGGHSVGATFAETAAWLAAFGASEGLMLDGGGSSALVVADSAGVPRLVNIPVQGTLPGIERPVANLIAIRSERSASFSDGK